MAAPGLAPFTNVPGRRAGIYVVFWAFLWLHSGVHSFGPNRHRRLATGPSLDFFCAVQVGIGSRNDCTETVSVRKSNTFSSGMKRTFIAALPIAFASCVLLVSDLGERKPSEGRLARVAVLQHASQALLDDAVSGIIAGLSAAGYAQGRDISIERFNAENDLTTANAIAKQIAAGGYNMVITVSTLSLQTMANANRAGKMPHVFGAVADPPSAGVGISRNDPLSHPKHLVGIGTLLPVRPAFELARRMNPALKSIGVVWNPGESNSEGFTKKARSVCADMGLQLLEATVDNSSGVYEAANSLVARGADALWVGGDVTVLVALDSAVAAARKGHVPVFSIVPPTVERGTLFDYGANFFDVGQDVGKLAARILKGADPATLPVRNSVPEYIAVNKLALKGLKAHWRFPPDILARADATLDESGRHEKTRVARLGAKKTIAFVQLNNVLDVEETEAGFLAGLKDNDLEEGTDFEIRRQNAQGDMATVSALVDNAVSQKCDLLVAFSTPTLQAAIRRAGDVPVVFVYVADGVIAGAGRSRTDHLPNVTGVDFISPYRPMLTLIRRLMPSARKLGTLFVPSEVNSVFMKDELVKFGKSAGFEIFAVAASTSTEVPDAATALAARGVDAICQVPGNLTAAAFASIQTAANRAKLPVFAFQTVQAREGAAVVLARDYFDSGKLGATLAVRILRGESPARIPIHALEGTKLMLNLPAAHAAGLTLPPDLINNAEQVIRN